MKKVLFSILLMFILIMNVNADEKYKMSKINLNSAEGEYYTTIIDDEIYLYRSDCITNSVNPLEHCELYHVNEKNELEKTDKKLEDDVIVLDPYEYWELIAKKHEDGSYILYSCLGNSCSLIKDMEISLLTKSSETYVLDLAFVNFYIVTAKDNTIAIYDGKGNKHLDFGNYEILGDIEYSESGIVSTIDRIILKDKNNGSYHFIGAEDKVVTLSKEIAEKIGVNDENVFTISHEIDKYYSLAKGYDIIFFTLNDGLLSNKENWDGVPKIVFYNNKYIIETKQFWDGNFDTYQLYTLDGDEITEEYHHIYYFDDKKEIILVDDEIDGVIGIGKFVKNKLDIHDGEKVVFSVDLENGDYIDEVAVDKEGSIWITTTNVEDKSRAIYILRTTSVKKEPELEDDEYSYKFVKGMNDTFIIDSTNFVTFTIDGDFKLFKEIYIDDKLLEAGNYTIKEGSTIVTLNNDYARKLIDEKEHVIKVVYSNTKEVSTTFKVEEKVDNPHTGQAISALFIGGLFGLALFIKNRRKTNAINKV